MPVAKQPPPPQVVAALERLIFTAQRDELPYGYVQASLNLCSTDAARPPDGGNNFGAWRPRIEAVIAPSAEFAGCKLRVLVQLYLANCHWKPKFEHFEFEFRYVTVTDGTFDASFGVYASEKYTVVGPTA